jgi:hypothetical protein
MAALTETVRGEFRDLGLAPPVVNEFVDSVMILPADEIGLPLIIVTRQVLQTVSDPARVLLDIARIVAPREMIR